MSDQLERLEALRELALLERLAAEQREARDAAEADRIEAGLAALVADPGPVFAEGDVVRGEDGRPVLDEALRRDAARALAELRAERAKTGGRT
jgi:hypothetical protein